jgi:hypothetical protein
VGGRQHHLPGSVGEAQSVDDGSCLIGEELGFGEPEEGLTQMIRVFVWEKLF